MRIAANILVVLLAAGGAFLLIAPHIHERAYDLFAPANAEVFFPFDKHTIESLFYSVVVTAAHVLFLSSVCLGGWDWPGWRKYAFRWLRFIGALLGSVVAFVALALVHRQLTGGTKLEFYAHRLPVNWYLMAVFLTSVAITLALRSYRARKARECLILHRNERSL